MTYYPTKTYIIIGEYFMTICTNTLSLDSDNFEKFFWIKDFTDICPQCESPLIWSNDFLGEDLDINLIGTIISH